MILPIVEAMTVSLVPSNRLVHQPAAPRVTSG